MSRSLKAFIVVSVLLNLLFTGYLFGDTGRSLIEQPHDSRSILHDLVKALPEEKRLHASEIVTRFEQDTGELREELGNARNKASDLLAASPFDRNAYMAQVQAIGQLKLQMAQRMAEAIASLAEQCSPEERQSLADIMRRQHHRLAQ